MNGMKWSAKNNAFFSSVDLIFYKKAGWDLSDIIDVDASVYDYFSSPPAGKVRSVEDGMPSFVDSPPPPPLSHDEEVAIADSQKSSLLQSASRKIGFWQTQLQLGMISDADKASLIAWMNYITALQSVDTSTAPDIDWPTTPDA
ncbi:tail fiber assembly protein [Plesiomonas shigelloides]|uniref:tail fiber assembly protein n=1 Tax=Plesiomonas shigelloides TaxID=703 RepID=UPI0012629D3A|nr:tail fiber assembly protein [Plesiomonas shigelloides]KAB7668105.1 tail assembly chaperone [Plesiomonas shigelloides]